MAMYEKKEDEFECKCGLKIDEIDFIDFRCSICYIDDFEITCISCGFTNNHETFTNNLCAYCFEWCAQ